MKPRPTASGAIAAASTKAKWIHPSIELLMRGSQHSTPEQAILAKARSAAQHARSFGWAGPPFDMRLLASILGIRERPLPGLAQDALIMPHESGEGFEILWDPDVPGTRQNFTFGHEITHTFFPDCADAIRNRKPLHRCDPQKVVEQLCDAGAAELLLPLDEFGQDLRARGVSLAAVGALRDRYEASREAVARRMVTLDVEPCAVAFLTCRLSPREQEGSRQMRLAVVEGPQPKYRVDMMFVSTSFGSERLPLHKSVPDASCVYEAAASRDKFLGGHAVGLERWPSGHGFLPRCHVHATSIPANGDGEPRVMALLVREGRGR